MSRTINKVLKSFFVLAVLLLVLTALGIRGTAAAAQLSTSPNWAGLFAEDSSQPDLHGAVSRWNVPTVTCSVDENSGSSVWIGIGGNFKSGGMVEPLYQDGVEAECVEGQPNYFAWQERYSPKSPSLRMRVMKSVAPTDVISASVIDRGLDTHWSLTDSRDGKQIWHSTGFWYTHNQHLHTAECIVEDPLLPSKTTSLAVFTDFGKIRFQRCEAIDQSGAEHAIDGNSLPNRWTATRYNMSRNGQVLAETSLSPLVVSYKNCSVDTLAMAASDYDRSSGSSGGVITAQACENGFAGADFSSTNAGGYGAQIAFQMTLKGWKALGEGNMLPPNVGIPPPTYRDIEQQLANSPQNESVRF